MALPKLKPGERHYYVLAEGMQSLAGAKIWTDEDNNQRITMTPNAAQYWMDQAAIGTQPLTSMPEPQQMAYRAMHGKPVEPKQQQTDETSFSEGEEKSGAK